MNRFFDLMAARHYLATGVWDFAEPDERFPAAVADSRLRLWSLGDPIPERGTRLLIGAATWSGYDMRLLDVIDDALARLGDGAPRVDVFNAGILTSQEEIQRYVPGIGPVLQMPVVGVWRDGRLV